MTTPTKFPNLQDDRWGGYVPWFLRHPEFETLGHFNIFFERVAHRLKQVVDRGEAGMPNITDLGDTIESESHQCFRFNSHESLAMQLQEFFSPPQIQKESDKLVDTDPVVMSVRHAYHQAKHEAYPTGAASLAQDRSKQVQLQAAFKLALVQRKEISESRSEFHYHGLVLKRLTVLECVLRLVKQAPAPAFSNLRDQLRRYIVETGIMLDITHEEGKIVPIEEPLLQKEVIDRLLPRLSDRFPQQEKDLVKAYHDLIQGVDADAIFVLAMKALEEIARQISGRPKLTLETHKDLNAAFPDLHPTICTTIIKLAAHRGDKAGHGRQGPPPHEMRYLLLSICNIALLFLDYPGYTAHT